MPYGYDLTVKNRRADLEGFVLDKLGADAVNSLVLGMSYVRMTKKYKGACLRVVRASDFSSIWVEFSAGYIAIAQIAAFCSGTEGRCPEHCNQSLVAGANNAVQATWDNMPIIYAGGVFNADGLRFSQANSTLMAVADYAAIQLTSAPITIYSNFYPTADDWGILFVKCTPGDINDIQFRTSTATGNKKIIQHIGGNYINENISTISSTNKYICRYLGSGANQVTTNNNSDEKIGTIAGTFANKVGMFLGAEAFTFIGNIKTLCIFSSDRYPDYDTFVAGGM